MNFNQTFLQVSSKTIGNSSTSKPKVNDVNDKKTKSIIKRKSIKYNCKALKKTSLRRSLRKSSKKIYTVEDVPDDDLNICKYFTFSVES